MSDVFLNSRIRYCEGQLLTAETLRMWSVMSSLSSLQSSLEAAGYRFLTSEGGGDCFVVERGLLEVYRERVQHLLRGVRGNSIRFYRLFLGEWDLHNMKTLIRSWIHRTPPERTVIHTLPLGFMDETTIRESLKQPSLQAMLDYWAGLRDGGSAFLYGEPVRHAWKLLIQKSETKNLSEAEMSLERGYHLAVQRFLRSEEGSEAALLRDWLRIEEDRRNLLTALRIAGEWSSFGEDPVTYFAGSGKWITLEGFHHLVVGTPGSEEFLKAVPVLWRSLIPDLRMPPLGIPHLLWFEFLTECQMLHGLSRRAIEDPLGLALGYLVLKKMLRELKMLRLIAMGIRQGIPPMDREGWVQRAYA